MNLSVNARDAMPGGGRMTIATANVALHGEAVDDGPAARVVRDADRVRHRDGNGRQTRSHVFEPFFTTKPQGKGTGLGLATVYGIVKQSDGHIQLESAPGSGRRSGLLPGRGRAGGGRSPPRRCRRAAARRRSCSWRTKTAPRFVAQIRAGVAHTVLEAGRRGTTLAVAYGDPGVTALLLTDVVMPGITGRQLAQEVTLRRPAIKVVFMSGYSDEALGARGILDPGTNLLPKPFTSAELDRCLAEVLGDPACAGLRASRHVGLGGGAVRLGQRAQAFGADRPGAVFGEAG